MRILIALLLCHLLVGATQAQLPDAPTFFKDKKVLELAGAQAASDLFDGFSTRYWVDHCQYNCIEGGLEHFAVGNWPTWRRMIPAGAVEVAGMAVLAHQIHKSRHKWIRRFWWVPQSVTIGYHTQAAVENYSTHYEKGGVR